MNIPYLRDLAEEAVQAIHANASQGECDRTLQAFLDALADEIDREIDERRLP